MTRELFTRLYRHINVCVVIIIAHNLVGCARSKPVSSAKDLTVTVQVPTFVPAREGQETQERSGVVVQMAPPLFDVNTSTVRTCSQQKSFLVTNNQHDYDVEETPTYSVSPEQVVFKVNVTNRTTQVLKLFGAVFTLNVNGQAIALEPQVTQTFVSGVLTPNQSQNFDITGPRWDSLLDNSTINFAISGMPTELDQAGNVTKRENFDWTFMYSLKGKQKQDSVKHSVVTMTPSEASESCANLQQ